MRVGRNIVGYCLDHPRKITLIMVIATVALGALIPLVKVDTDPENMLSETEPVRVFHNEMKARFTLYDMVVLGIVNETDPDGVFNPDSLKKIYELTEFAKGIKWSDPNETDKKINPVVEIDLLAPSTVDDIRPGAGTVSLDWLMPKPPETREEAQSIRARAKENPLLDGTLLSEDGKALCIYLPLKDKSYSYRVYSELKEKVATFDGDEEYHITGLPVAEDTFGVQMFIQMAISAPLAMLVIFILMFVFFRKFVLIISPMIVAMVSVICTMGLMIGLGYTVHIMNSMIPIFIMPIAVLDSIHILSEFFDRYQETKDSRSTSEKVMEELFSPMLYTSLTSAAGFASLALTPIPPVQVFGIFVALGILLAWALTVTFVPAYTTFISKASLENFGASGHEEAAGSGLSGMVRRLGGVAYNRAKLIIALTLVLVAVAVYGLTKININDNPVKWFTKSHPIRVADDVLNKHFGGTYMAYLVLESEEGEDSTSQMATALDSRLAKNADDLRTDWPAAVPVFEKARGIVKKAADEAATGTALLDAVSKQAQQLKAAATDYDEQDAWDEVRAAVELEKLSRQAFKRPEVLKYVADLQKELLNTEVVGKSNSVTDIVKKVHKELLGGDWQRHVVPDSSRAVAECLVQYQGGHDPDDLWHLVTTDYSTANLWVQLKSGDNKAMEKVVASVDRFFERNAPPVALKHRWFGLTYINVVWQNKMVSGMLQAFLGSFLIVFIMMTVLFRSPLWGILSMIPLTVTIGLIYGMIGYVGKDYDMPVAVLSALTLGLGVDFAIHFLARSRVAVSEHGSWQAAAKPMFGEPARAITRNIIVIAVGFLPLLAAPLMPYKTVGVFMAAILAVSGVATLFVLSALLRVLERWLFKKKSPVSAACNCAVCFASSAAMVVLVALSIHQYAVVGWGTLTWVSIIAIPILALACGRLSRRDVCRRIEETEEQKDDKE